MSIVCNYATEENLLLTSICLPVSRELALAEKEFKSLIPCMISGLEHEKQIDLINMSGDRLYAALLLLCAKSVNPHSPDIDFPAARLAAVMEILHKAIEGHGNVIDYNSIGRGLKAGNTHFKNKMAVLSGDVLYSQAFLTVLNDFPIEIFLQIAQLLEKVFLSELEMIMGRNVNTSKQVYHTSTDGSALLMGLCCRLGAFCAGAEYEDVLNLENYGYGLGAIYHIKKLYFAAYTPGVHLYDIAEIDKHVINVRNSIKDITDSQCKNSLDYLLEYVLDLSA